MERICSPFKENILLIDSLKYSLFPEHVPMFVLREKRGTKSSRQKLKREICFHWDPLTIHLNNSEMEKVFIIIPNSQIVIFLPFRVMLGAISYGS